MKLFRKFSRYVFYAFLLFPFCIGCVKKLPDANKIKELVFVVNLVNDESKVAEYLEYHKKIWPEVEAGLKKAGYKKIKVYRFNTSLVMILTIPENADINQIGRVAEAYDKKCSEWNQLMSSYQEGVTGTREGQKWVQAELFYSFKNE